MVLYNIVGMETSQFNCGIICQKKINQGKHPKGEEAKRVLKNRLAVALKI